MATAMGLDALMAGISSLTPLQWVLGVPVALVMAGCLIHFAAELGMVLYFTTYFKRRVREGLELKKDAAKYEKIPATVCISLKGADPALPDLIKALARQTHRAWHLRFIIDSREDPAWPVVETAVAEVSQGKGKNKPSWSSVTIEHLEDRMPKTGVRLGSALRQHMSRLHPETVVAICVDGDATMAPEQVTCLVAEVSQPGVGVVSGVRWIDLTDLSSKDCMRAMWNINCMPTIAIASLPWGGLMAIRRELIEAGEWDKELQKGFNSDLSLVKPIRSGGWKYEMVPAGLSIETDPAPPLDSLLNFFIRQSFGLYVHHHNPYGMLFVANSGPLLLADVLLVTLAACVAGVLPWAAMAVAGGIVAFRHLATALLTIHMHESVRAGLKRCGLNVQCPASRWAACSFLWATGFQLVNVYCTMTAAAITEVDWRGVVYRRENGTIRLIRDAAEEAKAKAS